MAKDMRKGDRHLPGYSDNYKRENYDLIQLRVRKDSGIMDALDMMNRLTDMPKAEYIRNAVADRLQQDGYMPWK